MSGEKKIDPKWKQLDRLGEKWSALEPAGDEAARSALEQEIFTLLFQIYTSPKSQDALMLFFETDWRGKGFHPEKGANGTSTLSSFVTNRMRNRMTDAVHELDHHAKGEDGKQHWISNQSLDQQQNEDEKQTLENRYITPPGEDIVDDFVDVESDMKFLDMISIILNLSERLGGRKNNAATRNYYRMFFTDGVTNYVHHNEERLSIHHERDLFHAMKVEFLDFYMAHACRSLAAMTTCPLRPYGQLVEGKPMEECPLPLKNDVYCSYLEREEQYKANQSAVSQQRTAYREFLREELGVS